MRFVKHHSGLALPGWGPVRAGNANLVYCGRGGAIVSCAEKSGSKARRDKFAALQNEHYHL